MINADTIPHRVQEILTKTPPFNLIDQDDLIKLIKSIKITLKQKDEVLFEVEQEHFDYFMLIERGSINLTNAQGELVAMCDEGEILAIAPLLRNGPFLLNAIINEETLLYCIPWKSFAPLMNKYAEVALYFASGFATGELSRAKSNNLKDTLFEEESFKNLTPHSNLILASPQDSLKSLAIKMKEHKIGSIIIANENKHPLGIVTQSDIVMAVATDINIVEIQAKKIMSSPVKTFKGPISTSEAILIIMAEKIRHLVFTQDGTNESSIVGILSQHDVLGSNGQNPIVLSKQIRKSKKLKDLKNIHTKFNLLLKRYLEQETSLQFLLRSSTQINDQMTNWIINQRVKELPEKTQIAIKDKWAWLAFGSQARKEQILSSDQDNGMIYDDSIADYADDLISLASKVNDDLDYLGFEYCPADVMARNTFYNRSVSQWLNQLKDWINTPEKKAIMYLTIFMDYRVVYGNQDFQKRIDLELKKSWKNELAMMMLAENALSNPAPLNFFRGFVIEKSGEHISEFNIKERAIVPIVDTARLLSIHFGVFTEKTTINRLDILMQKDPEHASLYTTLKDAFLVLQKHRVQSGIAKGDSGKFIEIDRISKIEKQKLRLIFKAIDDAHRVLKMKFTPNRGL